MRILTDFLSELRDDLNWLRRQRLVIFIARLFRVCFKLLSSLSQVSIKSLDWLMSRYLNHFATFAGVIILIFLIYFENPFWVRGLISLLLLIIGLIGRSFLDHKYLGLEESLEVKMLGIARRQATLGIPDKSSNNTGDPTLDEILAVAEKAGMGIDFSRTAQSPTSFTYVFTWKNEAKVEVIDSFPESLKRVLQLKSVPRVISGKNKETGTPELYVDLPIEIFKKK